jgi:PPOX class probable F420-dependent enzyme
MVTGRNSGKIKRIRKNGRVSLAPCDMMGHPLGPQMEASAHELPADQHAHANAVLARKYGKEYEVDASDDNGSEETFIEIYPVQE